jgi:signal transduction histidine kinase
MHSRGEAFARGATESKRRLSGEAEAQLRDEGGSTMSVGSGGPIDSRRTGTAPPAIQRIDQPDLRAVPDEPIRWRTAPAPSSRAANGAAPYPAAVRDHGPLLHRPLNTRAPKANLLAREAGRRFSIDRHWRITGATEQAAAWLGSADNLVGTDVRERATMPLAVYAAIEGCLRHGGSRRIEAASAIHPGRVEFTIHGFDGGATVSFVDISDQRLADPAAGLGLANPLDDTVSPEMALLDDRGVVVSVNAAWRDAAICAGQAGTGLGRSFANACQWLAPELDAEVIDKALAEVLRGDSQSVVRTFERLGPEGLWSRQVRIARLRVGDNVHIVATLEDLTEVARAHAALRDMSEQLLSAQEDERHRIAIELHDSTSQHLVALGIGLTNLRRLTANGERTETVLEEMSKSLKEAVKEIRVLSFLMNPPTLLPDGLQAHARRFVSGFAARTGLQISFSVQGAVDAFDAEVQHTFFRIIQEALANVYKHSEAKSASVSLISRRGALQVRIADDGKGIAGLANGGLEDVPLGVGVAGMRSRMAQLGGDLNIESGPHGTVVTGLLRRTPKRAPRNGVSKKTRAIPDCGSVGHPIPSA